MCVSIAEGRSYRIEVNGISHRVDRDDGGIVHSPSPAVVVSIAVQPGDRVSLGDRLAVLEAMKMEMQVVAPFSGRVRQVLTMPNVQVETGAPLVQLEPDCADCAAATDDQVEFGNSKNVGRYAGDARALPPKPRRTSPAHARLRCRSEKQHRTAFQMGPDLPGGQ